MTTPPDDMAKLVERLETCARSFASGIEYPIEKTLQWEAATAIRSLTEERDAARRDLSRLRDVENMLLLCGELGGIRSGEQLADYLRRLIDRLIVVEAEAEDLRQYAPPPDPAECV